MKINLLTAGAIGLSFIAVSSLAQSAGDPIIKKIHELKAPDATAAPEEVVPKMAAYAKQRDDLIWQLYKAAPGDSRTADLLEFRWSEGLFQEHMPDFMPAIKAHQMPNLKPLMASITAEIDTVLGEKPSAGIQEVGRCVKLEIEMAGGSEGDHVPEVNQFAGDFPKSKHTPMLLLMAAESPGASRDEKTAALHMIVTDYPESPSATQAKGELVKAERVNKPFELKFKDAISGKSVDSSDLKGKVVLVDFWATWCGPCVAEMPRVKKAYETYHSKGLEILGVSLDESEAKGGLKSLKQFVKDNQMPWPQYYQGNGWASAFSSSLGIDSIPTMFAIDKQGRYVESVDPRDQGFDEKIQKLLSQ